MIEARVRPTKDGLELAAELEARGVQVDWNAPGGPSAKPIDYGYDCLSRTFRVVQGRRS